MTTKSFMFGNPPFRFLANHLTQDTDFLDDAQQILGIDEDSFLQLATRLSTAENFLSRSDLNSIVDDSLEERSDRIASVIHKFSGILYNADMDVSDAMDLLSKSIEEKAEQLTHEEKKTLIDRIRKLVVEPRGIAKQFKAQELVDVIGAELDEFRIICDIRPIFDRSRERIDGAIPLAILRLEYSKPDGESAVTEVRITEKQIAKFSEEITNANLKIRMIKELLSSQNLPVPKTKSTL